MFRHLVWYRGTTMMYVRDISSIKSQRIHKQCDGLSPEGIRKKTVNAECFKEACEDEDKNEDK